MYPNKTGTTGHTYCFINIFSIWVCVYCAYRYQLEITNTVLIIKKQCLIQKGMCVIDWKGLYMYVYYMCIFFIYIVLHFPSITYVM